MSRRKPVILCVDDHWSGLIGRKMVLENNGYEVLEATGGDEGLKLFKANSVAYEYDWTLMRRTERLLVTGVQHG